MTDWHRIKKLGGDATLHQGAAHFVHAMSNKLMVLSIRGETREMARRERVIKSKVYARIKREFKGFKVWPRKMPR